MSAVKTIRMGFLEVDDRLLMDFVFADKTITMLVTRRITRRMIRGLAQILAQTNSVMARVPSSHKSDVLIWEHLSALQPVAAPNASPAGAVEPEQPDRPPLPWPLLQSLKIDVHKTHFSLTFSADGSLFVPLNVTREEMHRLIASIRQFARHAEWDLDAEVGWLVEADAPAGPPGSLVS